MTKLCKFTIVAALLCACGDNPEPGPEAVEPKPAEPVFADREDLRKVRLCLDHVRNETDKCIVRAVRKPNPSNYTSSCMYRAKSGRKACIRAYKDLFATCEPLEPAKLSDHGWMEDDLVPKRFVDCPEDLSGPGYVARRKEFSMPSVCVMNEITGEVW